MKQKILSLALLAIVFSFAFSACSEDKPIIPTPQKEENYISLNGKKQQIKAAFMGYAYIPGMATNVAFSTKDINSPDFSIGKDLTLIEIKEKLLDAVPKGEVDDIIRKSDLAIRAFDEFTLLHKDADYLEYTFNFKEVGKNQKNIPIYKISLKCTLYKGTEHEQKVELNYHGTLKTGGTGYIHMDNLNEYTEGGKINKEDISDKIEPRPEIKPDQPVQENYVSVNGGKKFKLKFAAMGYSKEKGMKTDIVLLGGSEYKNILKAQPSFIITVPNNIIDNPDDINPYGEVGLKNYHLKYVEQTRLETRVKLPKPNTPKLRRFVNDYPNGSYVLIKKEEAGGKAPIYDITFKFINKVGAGTLITVEGRYRGTLNTGGTGDIYKDNLEEYTEGGDITKYETPKIAFEDIKFSGNGFVAEITMREKTPEATYFLFLKGDRMFIDKNLNGIEDEGESIKDSSNVRLSLPLTNSKALLVLRGDIKKFQLNPPSHSPESGIKEMRIDASRCKSLRELYTYTGTVSELDVSGCKGLHKLYLRACSFKHLDITGLEYLDSFGVCQNNNITTALDFSDYLHLENFNITGSNFSSFILPRSNSCKRLNISNTKFTSLDMSRCANLEYLNCVSSNLVSLDLANCPKLRELIAFRSKELTEIKDNKASLGKPQLEKINIESTPKLTKFDFSKYVGLKVVDASEEIGVSAEELINRLPVAKDKAGELFLSKENAEKVRNNTKLKDKGWTVKEK